MKKHTSGKTASVRSATILAILLLAASSISFNQKRLAFQVNIDGSHKNYAGKELKLSDFGLLAIRANDKNMEVQRFDITLARGPRAVQYDKKVYGNSFDLKSYSELAREGDRIVIQVLEVSKTHEKETAPEIVDLHDEKSTVLTIPISFDK